MNLGISRQERSTLIEALDEHLRRLLECQGAWRRSHGDHAQRVAAGYDEDIARAEAMLARVRELQVSETTNPPTHEKAQAQV